MKKLTARLRRCAPMLGASALVAAISCAAAHNDDTTSKPAMPAASQQQVDSAAAEEADSTRYTRLTDDDFMAVARELDIPVAAIRAVVEIEAGKAGEGFNADHTPIINFDLSMFRLAAKRRGINLNKYKSTHAVVFNPPNRRKYGSQQAAQYARLHSALEIDTVAALEGVFWGMFQIGGFNWKLCGYESPQAFVSDMAYSERRQLEIFGKFIVAAKYDGYLRNRQWAKFASRYNGPGYKKHHYDTRMAAAFARYSKMK